MKKLLFILFVVVLTSCESGFSHQQVDQDSRVEVSYSDSTKWESAKVYQVSDTKMYVKTEKSVVMVQSFPPFIVAILLILAGMIVGAFLALKITES